MRRILDTSNKTRVPIADEIESLKLFLELEHLRFENKFNYHIEVDPEIDIRNQYIPTMLIQPYVENAIKHGINHSGNLGKILIKLEKDSDAIICTIEDNGIGIKRSMEKKS